MSPAQLAMVTVLQFAENLTDRQAADAVRGRLYCKYCLGLALDDEWFDFSVLVSSGPGWSRRAWNGACSSCCWPG